MPALVTGAVRLGKYLSEKVPVVAGQEILGQPLLLADRTDQLCGKPVEVISPPIAVAGRAPGVRAVVPRDLCSQRRWPAGKIPLSVVGPPLGQLNSIQVSRARRVWHVEHANFAPGLAERLPKRGGLQLVGGAAAEDVIAAACQLFAGMNTVPTRADTGAEARPSDALKQSGKRLGVPPQAAIQETADDRQPAGLGPLKQQARLRLAETKEIDWDGSAQDGTSAARDDGAERRLGLGQLPAIQIDHAAGGKIFSYRLIDPGTQLLAATAAKG